MYWWEPEKKQVNRDKKKICEKVIKAKNEIKQSDEIQRNGPSDFKKGLEALALGGSDLRIRRHQLHRKRLSDRSARTKLRRMNEVAVLCSMPRQKAVGLGLSGERGLRQGERDLQSQSRSSFYTMVMGLSLSTGEAVGGF